MPYETFDTVAAAQASTPTTAPDFITTRGYDTSTPDSEGTWKKLGTSAPAWRGPEKMADPSFDDANAWTLDPASNLSISGGALVVGAPGPAGRVAKQMRYFLHNIAYEVTFTIANYSAGGARVRFIHDGGTYDESPDATGNGTHTFVITPTAPNINTGAIALRFGSTSNLSITSFSVKQVLSHAGAAWSLTTAGGQVTWYVYDSKVINPRAFGAKGIGASYDDQPAIQAALNLLLSRGGRGKVHLPGSDGEYTLKTRALPSSDVALFADGPVEFDIAGDGKHVTRVRTPPANNWATFWVFNPKRGRFADMSLLHLDTNDPTYLDNLLLLRGDADTVDVDSLYLQGSGGYAISAQQFRFRTIRFTNLDFSEIGNDCIDMKNASPHQNSQIIATNITSRRWGLRLDTGGGWICDFRAPATISNVHGIDPGPYAGGIRCLPTGGVSGGYGTGGRKTVITNYIFEGNVAYRSVATNTFAALQLSSDGTTAQNFSITMANIGLRCAFDTGVFGGTFCGGLVDGCNSGVLSDVPDASFSDIEIVHSVVKAVSLAAPRNRLRGLTLGFNPVSIELAEAATDTCISDCSNLNANAMSIHNSALKSVRFSNNVGFAEAESFFLPTITADTPPSGVTYTWREGTFTRVGNRVHFNLRVRASSLGSGGSGKVRIGALPVAAGNSFYSQVSVSAADVDTPSAETHLSARIQPGLDCIFLYREKMGATGTAVQYADISTATEIIMTGEYVTD